MPRHRYLAVLAAVAVVTVGCTDDDTSESTPLETDAATTETEPSEADSEEGNEADAGTDAADDADAGDVDDAPEDDAPETADEPQNDASGEPLATAETTWGGIAGGEVRLDLLEVTRRGEDFMEVRFRITNTGEQSLSPNSRLAGDGEHEYERWASGLTVEDVDAGERLLVLMDSAGNCVCSTDLDLSIPAAASRDYFARFPAPVSDRVDVAIPSFATFNDIPVS